MIHRHGRCAGITLFRFRRKQVELWFCPKDEVIETHSHPNIDCKLIVLFGKMLGTIGEKTRIVDWRRWFRVFAVDRGVVHSAVILSFSAFLNIESWISQPTSAAVDFST